MYNLPNILFLVLCGLAGLVYILQFLGILLPLWINNYMNDFLCLPILLGLEQLFFRWFTGKSDYKFSLFFSLAMAAYYSFYFEYYQPEHNDRYTADLIDVLLYFLGAVSFYLFNCIPRKQIVKWERTSTRNQSKDLL